MREALVKTEEFKDSPVGRIPKDWDVKTLRELSVGGISNGFFKKPELVGSGYRLVNVFDLYQDFGIDLSFVERVNATEQEQRKYSIQPGDCFFTRSSLVLSGIAQCNIIRDLPEPALFECHLMRVRPDKSQVIPEFLALWCRSPWARKFFMSRAKQVTMTTISQPDIAPLPVPLPSKPEQESIVEIHDAFSDAIAHTSSLIAKLKQMKAGLLHDLLTRGLDENGELRDAIAHPEQFRDSPLGQIPKDWEVVPIQQAASQVPGATTIGPFGSNLLASDYRSVGVPVTFVRDIKTDGFQWNSNIYVEPKKARELSAHSVQSGDLLATKMGLPPCIACVYPEWMASGIITADIIRLRPDTQISTSQWLSLFVNSHVVIRQVRGITGGITRDKITLHDFRKLLIALPRLKEQKQITNILDTYNSRICCEEAYREKLKLQKQGLMHDLLTGKVRVNNA